MSTKCSSERPRRVASRRALARFSLLLLGAALACSACRTDSRRGVLLVTLDAVRADHLSCYGYPLKTTPYIDGLAARGAAFEQAVAVSSNTPVSHAAILTGLYPSRNGVRFIHGFQAHRLADGVPTMAGLFAGAGYSTAAFVSAFPLVASRYGLDRGFGLYDDGVVSDPTTAMSDEGFVAIKENQRKGEETIGRFLEWMRKEKPTRFFAWVHLFDAHDSIFMPPRDFVSEFEKKNGSDEAQKRRHHRYDIEIAYMDSLLQRLAAELDTVFPWERVQVVIVSDHGDGLGDHGYERHTLKIYQEQLQVPLIFSGRGLDRAQRIPGEVSTVDILPTLLDLNGIAVPQGLDGISLRARLEGRASSSTKRAIYAEALSPMSVGQPPLVAVIRDGRKLIYAPSLDTYELYDLKADPGELTNLAGASQSAALLEALKAELHKLPLTLDFKREAPLSAEDQEKLRALGYL